MVKNTEKIKIISCILILLCLFFAAQIVFSFFFKKEKRVGEDSFPDTGEPIEPVFSSVEIQPYSYYADVVGQRNLFSLQKSSSVAEATAGQASGDSNTNVSSLRLVGIILTDTPQAVFEDSQTQETFFVKQGESLKGAELKEILDRKVIMEGQTFELSR